MSGALRGIVVIFATAPQEVWHRLDGDAEAQEIPVMSHSWAEPLNSPSRVITPRARNN